MSSILVCSSNENLVLKRSKALQYKLIDLSGLSCGEFFDFVDSGEELTGIVTEEQENPVYTLVTKEFGLYGFSNGVSTKVKINFCDNGMMMVDVIEGAVLIRPEGEVLLASRNVDGLPDVNVDEIFWVDAEKLLSYRSYWDGLKSKYIQDFEYVFELKGGKRNNLNSFSVKLIKDEVIDISGGHISAIEARLKTKEDAKIAKAAFDNLFRSSNTPLEFEDDEDEDDSDEGLHFEEDDYDDDYGYNY